MGKFPWSKKPWEKVACNFTVQEYDASVGRGWSDVTEAAGEAPSISSAKELMRPGCLLPNSEVLTPFGYKEIQEIRTMERIWGHSEATVLKTFTRPYQGPLIEVKPRMLDKVVFTPEHPILVATKKRHWRGKHYSDCFEIVGWKHAKELAPEDYLVIPKFKDYRETWAHFRQEVKKKGNKTGKSKMRIIPSQQMTSSLAKIIGWYLAEGYACVDKSTVEFYLSHTEKENIRELVELLRQLGLKPFVRDRPTSSAICVYSIALTEYLKESFGCGAKNKHLSVDFLYWKPELLRSLIDAYVKGDGCTTKEGTQVLVSISKTLIKQIQLALFKLGVPASYFTKKPHITYLNGRKINAKNIEYYLRWSKQNSYTYEDEDHWFLKIRKLNHIQYNGLVHNLETTSEIYCVPFIVHNCHYRVIARAVEDDEKAGIKAGTYVGVAWKFYEPLPGGVRELKEPKAKVVKETKPTDVSELMSKYVDEIDRVVTPLAKLGEVFTKIRESVLGVAQSGGGGSEGEGGEDDSAYGGIPPLEYDGKAPWFMHPYIAHTIAEEIKGVIDFGAKRFEQVMKGGAGEAGAAAEEEEPLLPSIKEYEAEKPAEEKAAEEEAEEPAAEEEEEKAAEGEEQVLPTMEPREKAVEPPKEAEVVPSLLEGEKPLPAEVQAVLDEVKAEEAAREEVAGEIPPSEPKEKKQKRKRKEGS